MGQASVVMALQAISDCFPNCPDKTVDNSPMESSKVFEKKYS